MQWSVNTVICVILHINYATWARGKKYLKMRILKSYGSYCYQSNLKIWSKTLLCKWLTCNKTADLTLLHLMYTLFLLEAQCISDKFLIINYKHVWQVRLHIKVFEMQFLILLCVVHSNRNIFNYLEPSFSCKLP